MLFEIPEITHSTMENTSGPGLEEKGLDDKLLAI